MRCGSQVPVEGRATHGADSWKTLSVPALLLQVERTKGKSPPTSECRTWMVNATQERLVKLGMPADDDALHAR